MLLRLVALLAALSLACGQAATLAEPSPTELLLKASTNLKNAKTAHIDGTGSFAISSGLSISFDFNMNGDAEMPDTISIGGRTFSKGLVGNDWTETAENDPQGAILDPLGQADLSAVATVTEVDRPEVDGRKTRHLSYTIDQSKLLEKMKGSQPDATPALNVAAAIGKGEIWIRIDDSQIVRQLVKLSMEMDGGLGIPGTSPATGKSTFDISFDLKFTRIGEPISPAITAPPTP
jgi:hypothetical protein